MAVKLYSEVLGREVEIPDHPERIVSLAPAITETLYLLGLKDRIAGVSHFCNKPPEAKEKPRLGSYFQVNYRKLDELNPDLILVTTGAQRRLALELDEKGYRVYPIPLPVSVLGVIDMVVQVGLVTGEVEGARRLSARLAEDLSRVKPLNGEVKAYYEIDLGGPVSVGANSYIGDALDRLGLDHVFRNRRQSWIINPDPEEIIEYNPDVIIYEKAPYKTYSTEKIIEDLKKRGLDKTRALQEDNIILLDPDSLAHYGPSLIETLALLREKTREILKKQ